MEWSQKGINLADYLGEGKDPASIFNEHSQNEVITYIKTNLDLFNTYDESFKSAIIGQMMFGRIKKKVESAELIPKITGMLIDFDVLGLEEQIELLENDDCLDMRLKEASDILLEQDC